MTKADDLVTDPPDTRFSPQGLTKREYFAAMAMQGMFAHPIDSDGTFMSGLIPIIAVEAADELIEALNKEKP